MLKVTVLGLGGCHWCQALTGELDELQIPYSFVDANESKNSALADQIEALLNTQEYPMIILSSNAKTYYYIFRPEVDVDLGLGKTSDGCYKIGCATIDAMISNLQEIFKKY